MPEHRPIQRLTVLYDGNCGFCHAVKQWIAQQPAYIALHFLPQGSEQAIKAFAQVDQLAQPQELIVISDRGEVYRGDRAYLMCLFALRRYRPLAMRLSRPPWQGLARRAFGWLTRHRQHIGHWLAAPDDDATLRRIACEPDTPRCQTPYPSTLAAWQAARDRRG